MKNNAVITCLNSNCPERKSLCCGAGSRAATEPEKMLGVPEFFCSKCGKKFKGGKCTAGQNLIVTEFLVNSNLIENEKSIDAMEDAHEAWNYAVSLKKIKTKELLEIHRLLMRRINPRIAGKIRDVDVYIGGRMGADPRTLGKKLREFFKIFPLLVPEHLKEDTAIVTHVEFEAIHPFEDGNGRTGRILYNWQRLKYGLPIHVIHIGDEQYAYYDWFKEKEEK